MKNCPKCSYSRKPADTAPDWQCPACGIAYAKYPATPPPPARPSTLSAVPDAPFERRGFPFAKAAFSLALVAALGWGWHVGFNRMPDLGKADFSRSEIVMYSQQSCAQCVVMKGRFAEHGIPFTEKMIDADRAALDEFWAKLKAAGHNGGMYGTPTLEVNGKMMPNNPAFGDVVRQALRKS